MRILIIGGGIVGLGCAYQLLRDGHEVTVLDRDPAGDKASFGNAGGIGVSEIVPASVPGLLWRVPRWLCDPLGPLSIDPRHAPRLLPWLLRFLSAGRAAEVPRIAAALAALNARVYADLLPMLDATGLRPELHQVGALAVYTSSDAFARDREEWQLRRRFGVACEEISGDEARRLEPALAPIVRCAVRIPDWSHVSDPRRIHQGLLAWLRANGVTVETGMAADLSGTTPGRATLADGRQLDFDRLVIAAGAWSAALAAKVGDRVLLESERGYNTTIAEPGVTLHREVIFAEDKFVATPLSIGLRIGGAAEFAGLERAPNYRRSSALLALARRYLPQLSQDPGTPWMGHRPATPDSLPVIGPSPRRPDVFYAFGHGHVGLTQSATTGRLIADLVAGRTPPVDLAPYGIERFT
jgi:D-amino-acid dehydrogenase